MSRQMKYESIASQFDSRYTNNEYGSLERFLLRFISGKMAGLILEIGCGTGHWLEVIGKQGYQILGLDPSSSMLSLARQKQPQTLLIQGRAEAIPCSDVSFNRVFFINALHHFTDKERSIEEAYRVLRPGGGLLTVGLDPHKGLDQWSIYDYWPETLKIDKERYLPAIKIRQLLRKYGFLKCRTLVAQTLRQVFDARAAINEGRLAEHVTSQLGVLTNEEYDKGLHRLLRDIEAAESKGIVLKTKSDLRLYATTGWKA